MKPTGLYQYGDSRGMRYLRLVVEYEVVTPLLLNERQWDLTTKSSLSTYVSMSVTGNKCESLDTHKKSYRKEDYNHFENYTGNFILCQR